MYKIFQLILVWVHDNRFIFSMIDKSIWRTSILILIAAELQKQFFCFKTRSNFNYFSNPATTYKFHLSESINYDSLQSLFVKSWKYQLQSITCKWWISLQYNYLHTLKTKGLLNQDVEKEHDVYVYVYVLASPTPYAHSVTVINFDNGSNSITKFIWHTATVPH